MVDFKVYEKGWVPPLQGQVRPGLQSELDPPPIDDTTADGKPYKPAGKLEDKTAIITGADSGIGRAIALLYALEGADLTLTYLDPESSDASDVKQLLEKKAPKCKFQLISTDLRGEKACQELVQKHISFHSSRKLDILVLNHGTQRAVPDLTDLPSDQWLETFETNIHPFFYTCKAALPKMPKGGSIILCASINPFVGHPELVDYTATKGAIIGFMRALSNQIAGEKGIRVNAVAPGPIWTPLIVATMTDESKKTFGTTVPIGRAGQPIEVATCFVFLASADSSYISGQVIHVNGGVIIN
ncbi:hypothetical protein M422DRAFT_25031 [Sphaerobolus stellatus SS14]|nr:hypothetical protein M422DRAFT_25031 [Sphaerobolus stellatus SS14]